MSKNQIHKRVCPEAIARVLRNWNDGTITTAAAMQSLEVSRPQLYRLRQQAGKFQLTASAGIW